MKTGRKKASIALIMVLCMALLGACGAAGEGAAGSAPGSSGSGEPAESAKAGMDDKAAETGTGSTEKGSGKEDRDAWKSPVFQG